LEKPGGVADYYRVMRPRLSHVADYLTVGARTGDNCRLASILQAARDASGLVRALRTKPYDLVHLNRSLQPKALTRDGISLLIAKAFRKKLVVFVRGWDNQAAPLTN